MMKKSLLYSAAVLATWGITSCSNEVLDDGLDQQSTGQVIELAVDNAGSGLATRAGRPLLSSEAKQELDKVYVFVVETKGDTKTVVSKHVVENWSDEESTTVKPYNDASGHGRKTRIELKKDVDALKDASGDNYEIYAIGISTGSKYNVESQDIDTYLNGITINSVSKLENLVLSNGTSTTADEFFAGKATIKFSDKAKGKFSQGITLHRQVAGIFTYVKNVPYMLDSKGNVCQTLQLVASNPNKDIVLGMFYDKTLNHNGTHATDTEKKPLNSLKNVINGTNAYTSKQVISTIDLTQWFSKLQDVNNDGVLDRYEYKVNKTGDLVEDTDNQIWINPRRNAKSDVTDATFVKGSVFNGQFIIPFQKNDTQTFTLELLGKDNSEVVRSWNINLPSVDFVKGNILNIWKDNVWTTTEANYADEANKYSVLRNHLYGVGTKVAANPSPVPNPNPGPGEPDPKPVPDPEEPTPDVEDPQDLNTKQDILLQVNDNWEVIHKMEVE